jgi:hypothetical protein
MVEGLSQSIAVQDAIRNGQHSYILNRLHSRLMELEIRRGFTKCIIQNIEVIKWSGRLGQQSSLITPDFRLSSLAGIQERRQ